MFSRNVTLPASDGHPIFQQDVKLNPAQNITIGNHVWLADNVTVLKGVEIGENSVVGIHSVVTNSIAVASVAIGSPAKVLKKDIS